DVRVVRSMQCCTTVNKYGAAGSGAISGLIQNRAKLLNELCGVVVETPRNDGNWRLGGCFQCFGKGRTLFARDNQQSVGRQQRFSKNLNQDFVFTTMLVRTGLCGQSNGT